MVDDERSWRKTTYYRGACGATAGRYRPRQSFPGRASINRRSGQSLTMEYLQGHPVWQYMLKRFEADQIAASGPPLHEIEMCLGLAPIEYANWVKFESKDKRIAWSQAIKCPKGEG